MNIRSFTKQASMYLLRIIEYEFYFTNMMRSRIANELLTGEHKKRNLMLNRNEAKEY